MLPVMKMTEGRCIGPCRRRGADRLLALGLKPPIQERWQCLTQLHKYEPHGDLWLRVPEAQQSELIDHVRRFARQENLWFAVDFYTKGDAGIPHERVVMDACSRPIAFHLDNTHRPHLFSIFAVRRPGRRRSKPS